MQARHTAQPSLAAGACSSYDPLYLPRCHAAQKWPVVYHCPLLYCYPASACSPHLSVHVTLLLPHLLQLLAAHPGC